MLKRSYRVQESLVRYWAQQAVEMYGIIGDEGMRQQLENVQQSLAAMEGDRRVMVIGGAKVGKTSLLSYIAGLPVIRSGKREESPYLRWRYRNDDGDATRSCFVPLEELQGIEFVDTGDCADPAVAESLLELLPGSDAAVVVVDSRQGGASPAWDLLERLPFNAVGSVVVALTFTDKIAATDALTMATRIREMCRDRLRLVVLVCTVCPTSDVAVEMFATRVQEALDSPEGARRAIRNALEATGRLMIRQSTVINARTAVSEGENGFLNGIEEEIDNFLSHQLDGVPQCAENYANVPLDVLPRLQRKLYRSFGWVLSPRALMQLEDMGAGAELSFYRLVCGDIVEMQRESDNRFVASCQSHWRSVAPRMKSAIECDLDEFPQDVLEADLMQLRRQLEHDLYQPFIEMRIRNILDRAFSTHLSWMRTLHALLCMFLVLGGLLGYLGWDTPALWCLGAVVLLWLGGTVAHVLAVRRLARTMAEEARTLHAAVQGQMQPMVRDLVISRVTAYRRLYAVAGHRVREYVAKLRPLQERHNAILYQLRATAPRI